MMLDKQMLKNVANMVIVTSSNKHKTFFSIHNKCTKKQTGLVIWL